MKQSVAAVCVVAVALLVSTLPASGQSPYRVDYFANANTTGAPDATLRLDNDGSAADLDLCADIFVFNTNEEISECCSCLETPDDLLTLDININLLSNPANGLAVSSGVIKIVAAATTSGWCPFPAQITLVRDAEIQGWATHAQNDTTLTEAPSQASNLSSAEVKKLTRLCGAILATESGTGVCNCTGAGN
jgi:hypothetical protein